MRLLTIDGRTGPAHIVVGTWDPFTVQTECLLRELREVAAADGMPLVAVAFDPAPALYLGEAPTYPMVNGAMTRVAMLRAAGADGVLLLRFEPEDISGTAAGFFDLIASYIDVKTFHIGAHQSLGRGKRGSRRVIKALGRERGFDVQLLRRQDSNDQALQTREALSSGAVSKAVEVLGRPPVLSPQGVTDLCASGIPWTWPNGMYRALETESCTPECTGAPIEFVLSGPLDRRSVSWSRRPAGPYVAVVEGPGDRAERSPRRRSVAPVGEPA